MTSKTPVLDSLLITSCESLLKGREVSSEFNNVNEAGDYWNIDDILAEEEMIPCRFKEDAKDLSFLDAIDSQGVKAEGKKSQA